MLAKFSRLCAGLKNTGWHTWVTHSHQVAGWEGLQASPLYCTLCIDYMFCSGGTISHQFKLIHEWTVPTNIRPEKGQTRFCLFGSLHIWNNCLSINSKQYHVDLIWFMQVLFRIGDCTQKPVWTLLFLSSSYLWISIGSPGKQIVCHLELYSLALQVESGCSIYNRSKMIDNWCQFPQPSSTTNIFKHHICWLSKYFRKVQARILGMLRRCWTDDSDGTGC